MQSQCLRAAPLWAITARKMLNSQRGKQATDFGIYSTIYFGYKLKFQNVIVTHFEFPIQFLLLQSLPPFLSRLWLPVPANIYLKTKSKFLSLWLQHQLKYLVNDHYRLRLRSGIVLDACIVSWLGLWFKDDDQVVVIDRRQMCVVVVFGSWSAFGCVCQWNPREM